LRKITKKAVLNEIAAVAFSDFSKFARISSDGEGNQVIELTDTAKLSADCRKALCSIKAGTKGIEVKLYDKLRALELLGRVCGIYDAEEESEKEAIEQLRSLFEGSDVFGSGTVDDS